MFSAFLFGTLASILFGAVTFGTSHFHVLSNEWEACFLVLFSCKVDTQPTFGIVTALATFGEAGRVGRFVATDTRWSDGFFGFHTVARAAAGFGMLSCEWKAFWSVAGQIELDRHPT